MVINDWVHSIAGAFILISLGLGVFVNPNWFWLTAFVGANLLQFGFSKVCPLAMILKKLGVPES